MLLFIGLKKFFKDDNFGFILYCNFLFVFAIILIYFYYQIYNNSSFKKVAFIAELIEDLDKSPIFNLENKWKESKEGSYYIISFGKWKGSNIGCLCKEGKKRKCSKEDELNGCKNSYEYNYNSGKITRKKSNCVKKDIKYVSHLYGYFTNEDNLFMDVNIGYLKDGVLYDLDDNKLGSYDEDISKLSNLMQKASYYRFNYVKDKDDFKLSKIELKHKS